MKTKVNVIEEPKVEDAKVVEGLPGVGHVGKLAVEQLIETLGAEKFAELHSSHLPPQVLVEDGEAKLVSIELYAAEEEDLVLILGDHQAVDNEGHYVIIEAILEALEDLVSPSIIYTLGGFGTGQMVEEPEVLGAVNDVDIKPHLEDVGVEFDDERPAGGIVGASGLFLGLGELRGIDAACLMGETSGYIVDPKGAKAVLSVLADILGVEVDMEALDEKAEELEEFVSQLMEQAPAPQQQEGTKSQQAAREDLNYIG